MYVIKHVYVINRYPAKLIYLNFHPLDPQLQVGENYLQPICLF